MRILISGSSGLIGRATTERLVSEGHAVGKLARPGAGFISPGDVAWTPGVELPVEELKDVDAVIHLAGKTVAGRWGDQQKRAIRESRIPPTAALARSIAASYRQFRKPSVFLSASAIGCYGSRGDEELTEESALGHGFLADVARDWESATDPARDAGVRVVLPRIALVLSADGGALGKMLPIFKLGLAGRIGSGRQWWSWITLDDLTRSFSFAIANPAVAGPYNASAPNPVRNAEFTSTLAKVLHRPAIFPLPAAVARGVFRSAADELMLSSQRVLPRKLGELGFRFEDDQLVTALRKIVAK